MDANNESFSVDITRTRDDYIAFSRHVARRNNTALYFIISLVVVVLLSLELLELTLRHNFWGLPKRESVIAAITLLVIIIFAAIKILNKVLTPRMYQDYFNENQAFLRKKCVTIDHKGFRETSDISEGFVLWQGVDRIEKTKTLLLVFVDKMIAYVIPIRNFSTPEQANRFYENMLAYWHKANGRAVPVNAQ